MTLNIRNYDGSTFITIPDQTLNSTAASIEFPGRGLQAYGTAVNQDLLWLMQHFARSTPPDSPVAGQAWWDSSCNLWKIYTGSDWIASTTVTNAGNAPNAAVEGTLWWNSSHSPAQLNVFINDQWQWIGPVGYEYWSSTQNNIPYTNQFYTIGNSTAQMSEVHTKDSFTYRNSTVGGSMYVANTSTFTNSIYLQGTGNVYSGWSNDSAALDNKKWWRDITTSSLNEYVTADNNTNPHRWLSVNRSGNAISSIELLTNNNNVAVIVDQAGNVNITSPGASLVFPDGSHQPYAAFHRTWTYYNSNVFVVPPDCTHARVRVWGAGAGGGGNNSFGSAGGGGGGGYAETIVVLLPGSSIPVTVGQGGYGGGNSAVSLNDGGSGGTSSFGVYVSSTGGLGGLGTVAGGAGSGGGGGAGYGCFIYGSGGNGGGGFTVGLSSIGGHGGAGAMGGGGGTNGLYAGPGSFPGGGGGGGSNDSPGGIGAGGMIVVEY